MGLHRYVILDAARVEEAIDRAVRAAVHEVLADGTELALPGEATVADVRAPSPAGEKLPAPPGMYRVGTAAGEVSYAEVVYHELREVEFEQEAAMEVIEQKVFDLSDRYRDSARRSLDNDERFVRLTDRVPEVWWRRKDATQIELGDD